MRDIDPKRLHDIEEQARSLAHVLDEVLQKRLGRRTGFALLMFDFEGPELTWISNAQREDMLKALRELVARFEAGTADELSRPKGRG